MNRTIYSAVPSFISLPSAAKPSKPREILSYGSIVPGDSLAAYCSPYFHVVGPFLYSAEIKINSFAVLCGELGTNLHFLLSLIHFHRLIFCVSLPTGSLFVCFCVTV